MAVFYSRFNVLYALAMGFGIFVLNLAAYFIGSFERYFYPHIIILESLLIITLSYFIVRRLRLISYTETIKTLMFIGLLASVLSVLCTYIYLLFDDSMLNAIFFKCIEEIGKLKLSDEQLQHIMDYGTKLLTPFYFSTIFKGLIPILLVFIFSTIISGLFVFKRKK